MPTLDFHQYTGQWQIKFSAALPAAITSPTGIYFDGLYFWVIHSVSTSGSADIYQLYLTDAGTLSICSTFNLTIPLGTGESLESVQGITGDGIDLYIAYLMQVSSGGMPPVFSFYSAIAKVTKSGHLLDYNIAPFSGTYNDLSWDGLNILASIVSPPGVATIEVVREKIVYTYNLARATLGIAFNGNSVITVLNNNRAVQFSRDGNNLTTNPLIPVNVKGIDFATGELNNAGFADLIEGEAVLMVRL